MNDNIVSKLGRTFGIAAAAFSMTMAPVSAADYPEMKLKVAHALSETFLWSDVDKWFFNRHSPSRVYSGPRCSRISFRSTLLGKLRQFLGM